MQFRFNDKFIHTVYITIFELRGVCKAKGIPEAEEITCQAIGPAIRVCLLL